MRERIIAGKSASVRDAIGEVILKEIVSLGGTTASITESLKDQFLWRDVAMRILNPSLPRLLIAPNYEVNVAHAAVSCGFNWVSPYIDDSRFPPERRGRDTLDISLVVADSEVTTPLAIALLSSLHLRPITIRELLAVESRHADRLAGIDIAALGSTWSNPRLGDVVPVKVSCKAQRELRLKCTRFTWSKGWYFAAATCQ